MVNKKKKSDLKKTAVLQDVTIEGYGEDKSASFIINDSNFLDRLDKKIRDNVSSECISPYRPRDELHINEISHTDEDEKTGRHDSLDGT